MLMVSADFVDFRQVGQLLEFSLFVEELLAVGADGADFGEPNKEMGLGAVVGLEDFAGGEVVTGEGLPVVVGDRFERNLL